jgi:hypothetical protein
VVLARPTGEQQVVRTGPGLVRLVGEPGEAVLLGFGRDAARVEVEGTPQDVSAFRTVQRRF